MLACAQQRYFFVILYLKKANVCSPDDGFGSPFALRLPQAAKVKGIAWMGGRYPSSQSPYPGGPTWPAHFPEHNFGFRNISNVTADALALWPVTPQAFSKLEDPDGVRVWVWWQGGAIWPDPIFSSFGSTTTLYLLFHLC